jgi:mannose-6-phosphate isomerase
MSNAQPKREERRNQHGNPCRLVRVALVFGILSLAGCDPATSTVDASLNAHTIDGVAARESLIRQNLKPWFAAAPATNGCFRQGFDRTWKHDEKAQLQLVTQSRLIYAFAVGFDVTGDTAYRDQVRAGAECLLNSFRDPEFGGWYTSLNPDATPKNTNKRAYAHAFAVFALSHAYRITKDDRYSQAALETWRLVKDRMGDPFGGILTWAPRNFKGASENSQNHIMHWFEALLALHDATASPEILRDAQRIADFTLVLLAQRANNGDFYIPEHFDDAWKPLPPDKGGHVDLGHQFEWAFLLSSAAERGMGENKGEKYARDAEGLLQFGLFYGLDRARGGTAAGARYDGKVSDARKGFWQQAEALRALAHFAKLRGRSDLWEGYGKTIRMIDEDFVDKDNGGWHNYRRVDCRENCGNEPQPEPYHMVSMYSELVRLAGLKR